MRKQSKKALFTTVIAMILCALVVGIIGFVYLVSTPYDFCCFGTDIRVIQIITMTFNATTATLNFTLNNPDPQTTVSSVTINQMLCDGNFALVKANAKSLSESCIVSGVSFTKGETVNYIVSLADGQSLRGAVASIMLSVFGAILLQTSLLKEGAYMNPHPTPSWVHYVLAAILASGAFFFAWIWVVPGQDCSLICTYNPSETNLSFVSVAIYCALLTCVESVIGFKSRNDVGKVVPEPSKRLRQFRILGTLFLMIGTFVTFAGFYLLNNTSFQDFVLFRSCFPAGCSASQIVAINAPWYAIFYGGMILVGLGEVLILATKFMKTVEPLQMPTLTN